MKQIIVFGNDHTNSVGIIQSLGKVGYSSIALVYGRRTGFVKSSKYTTKVISAVDAQSCIEKLLKEQIQGEVKIPIIASCDMAALTLEKNKHRLSDKYVFEYSKNYSLEYLSVKEVQVNLAIEAGFNVPKSWNLHETREIPYDVTFPCLIKPLVSCEGAKTDIRVCHTMDELKRNLQSLVYTKQVLLQQYIDRDYEISILGCGLSNGECLIPAVENKLTLYPKYVGLECLANMQKLKDLELINCINNLIKKIGYVGLFSVEMMHCKTDDKFYFTEINLRNDGAESFVTKYGANLPLNHVQDLLGIPLSLQTQEYPGYYIWEMHHFMSLITGDINFFEWLSEILKSKGFLMSSSKDIKPFFVQFIGPILTKLKIQKGGNYQ